jgi:hypothetical protein
MQDDAHAHDLQVLNACVTPGCYNYIRGKKVKWEKDERERQKRWHRVMPSSSLSGANSVPYSAGTSRLLSFWPLRLLVQRAMAMSRPVCPCVIEDRMYVRPDLGGEGVGGTVAVPPVAIAVWSWWWWNDQGHVGSEHGYRAPVRCARSCPSHRRGWAPQGGPPWLSALLEGSACPLGEA